MEKHISSEPKTEDIANNYYDLPFYGILSAKPNRLTRKFKLLLYIHTKLDSNAEYRNDIPNNNISF